MRHRWWALAPILSVLAVASFFLPVGGGCGPAGLWALHVLTAYDPTGPGDPAGVYADFNACRAAARTPALLFVAVGLAAALAWGAVVISRRRSTASDGRGVA